MSGGPSGSLGLGFYGVVSLTFLQLSLNKSLILGTHIQDHSCSGSRPEFRLDDKLLTTPLTIPSTRTSHVSESFSLLLKGGLGPQRVGVGLERHEDTVVK